MNSVNITVHHLNNLSKKTVLIILHNGSQCVPGTSVNSDLTCSISERFRNRKFQKKKPIKHFFLIFMKKSYIEGVLGIYLTVEWVTKCFRTNNLAI